MNSSVSTANQWQAGIWANNPGLVQLLGLCPLLAVTTSAVNGLTLGLATLTTLTLTNGFISLLRPISRPEIRLPVFVLVIATVVTAIELSLAAFAHELYLRLGLFIPLIVTNCIILARADGAASRVGFVAAISDGLSYGLGMAGVLVGVGAVRELVGHGSLFAGLHLLMGDWAKSLEVGSADGGGLLLALLAPGAFFVLALGVSAHRLISDPTNNNASGRQTP